MEFNELADVIFRELSKVIAGHDDLEGISTKGKSKYEDVWNALLKTLKKK